MPSLVNLQKSEAEARSIIVQGRNSMPAFDRLRPAELDAVMAYLKSPPQKAREVSDQAGESLYDGRISMVQ